MFEFVNLFTILKEHANASQEIVRLWWSLPRGNEINRTEIMRMYLITDITFILLKKTSLEFISEYPI